MRRTGLLAMLFFIALFLIPVTAPAFSDGPGPGCPTPGQPVSRSPAFSTRQDGDANDTENSTANGTVSDPNGTAGAPAFRLTIDASSAAVDVGETLRLAANLTSSEESAPEFTYLWYIPSRPGGDPKKSKPEAGDGVTVSFDRVGVYRVVLQAEEEGTGGETAQRSTDVYVITHRDFDPVADAGADITVNNSLSVTLDGSGSFDPDGDVMNFTWSLAGSPDRHGRTVAWTFDGPGKYTLTLTVDDEDGRDTDQVVVRVNEPESAGGDGTGETTSDGDGDDTTDEDFRMLVMILALVVIIVISLVAIWLYTGRTEREPGVRTAPAQPSQVSAAQTQGSPVTIPSPAPTRGVSAPPAGRTVPARVSPAVPKPGPVPAPAPKAGLPPGPPARTPPSPPKISRGPPKPTPARSLEVETKKLEKEMENELKDLGISFE